MGRVISICTSKHKGTLKNEVNEANFIEEFGIEGDAHAGKWHRQVSLLALEKIEDIDLSKPNRIYFIGTCTSCNRKIKVRNDGLYPNRIGCSKCMGKWRSENFKM